MQAFNPKAQASILLPLIIYLAFAQADLPPKLLYQNVNTTSPWLNRINNRLDPQMNMTRRPRPRDPGCWNRPWICRQGDSPPRIRHLCCRNRCVDVSSDVNNCGLCGVRCPFSWQCCRGFCINTNLNPFHCGSCFHRCPRFSFCLYGMCGYAQPLPPRPPFPYPPYDPRPKPPHGPWPKPPHGPWPKPPHGPHHGSQPQPPPSG